MVFDPAQLDGLPLAGFANGNAVYGYGLCNGAPFPNPSNGDLLVTTQDWRGKQQCSGDTIRDMD